MNISDFYKYSQFATLAYVDYTTGSDTRPTEAIALANAAERVPGVSDGGDADTLGEKIFIEQGWRIANFHENDASGFAATLFENPTTGEKILAIRGTEPTSLINTVTDLFIADIGQIGLSGM